MFYICSLTLPSSSSSKSEIVDKRPMKLVIMPVHQLLPERNHNHLVFISFSDVTLLEHEVYGRRKKCNTTLNDISPEQKDGMV